MYADMKAHLGDCPACGCVRCNPGCIVCTAVLASGRRDCREEQLLVKMLPGHVKCDRRADQIRGSLTWNLGQRGFQHRACLRLDCPVLVRGRGDHKARASSSICMGSMCRCQPLVCCCLGRLKQPCQLSGVDCPTTNFRHLLAAQLGIFSLASGNMSDLDRSRQMQLALQGQVRILSGVARRG